MIYYKAVCTIHGWESPGLYKEKVNANRSAQAHRRNVPGPHEIIILQVYIPDKAIQIKSGTNMGTGGNP
jgi:hypothetical protein